MKHFLLIIALLQSVFVFSQDTLYVSQLTPTNYSNGYYEVNAVLWKYSYNVLICDLESYLVSTECYCSCITNSYYNNTPIQGRINRPTVSLNTNCTSPVFLTLKIKSNLSKTKP